MRKRLFCGVAALVLACLPFDSAAMGISLCSVTNTSELRSIFVQCDALVALEVDAATADRASMATASTKKANAKRVGREAFMMDVDARVSRSIWGRVPSVLRLKAASYEIGLMISDVLVCVQRQGDHWHALGGFFRVTGVDGPCPLETYQRWGELRGKLVSASTVAERNAALVAILEMLPHDGSKDAFARDQIARMAGGLLDKEMLADAYLKHVKTGAMKDHNIFYHLQDAYPSRAKYAHRLLSLLESPHMEFVCEVDSELRRLFPRARAVAQCTASSDRASLAAQWKESLSNAGTGLQ